jgi:hypothetical protein
MATRSDLSSVGNDK